ncbi:MAG: 2-oxoglutarate dehydrogenase E1 component [Polyangiales bacterium]
MSQDFGINQAFVDELYHRWQENHVSVGERWNRYFEALDSGGAPNGNGYGNGHGNGHVEVGAMRAPAAPTTLSIPPAQAAVQQLAQRVNQLIHAYRLRGHLWAHLDPLGLATHPPKELEPTAFGLTAADLDAVVPTGDLVGLGAEARVRDIVAWCEETYCRTIAVEFMHIEDLRARKWLCERMESTANRLAMTAQKQLRVLGRLIDAEIFEQFLHTNFLGAKRFSLEGGESLIPLMDLVLERLGELGAEEVIIGMAHRGRLNVLYNIMQKSPKDIFARFLDRHPEQNVGRGDVKYHLGYSSDRPLPDGRSMHLSLSFNPSHLEFVNPVVEGRVRAKQDRRGDHDRARVVPLLVHGDAAFIGQGVVAETLNLMNLEGYTTGGTVHVVVNNQVGFTTSPDDARSTRYATDLAKMLGTPIFHVNGEDPEAVAQVAHLAAEYRQEFRSDVVIDMLCYRKWGHNEGDEPRFTQPVMYATIDKKPSVRTAYVARLLEDGKVNRDQVDQLASARKESLDRALTETKATAHPPVDNALAGLWSKYKGGADASVPEVVTGVEVERLKGLIEKVTEIPADLKVSPKLRNIIEDRRERANGRPLDWGTAEALAYATLLEDGARIRLSGQDARRGTFSHRHSVWTDIETGRAYTPYSALGKAPACFEVWDSALSECGVLGFDYGYSLDYPDGLVMWEAQFGDFANGAQVIIDQFISSGEDKWSRLSGIVLLLPHGFEGQGPEHSSARLERFLPLCAEDNLVVCNPTTPAQIFHLLRRQVLRPWRKPLIVMTPKSHLRSKDAVSPLEDLGEGTAFRRVIPDPTVDPQRARKVLLCSGKIYYDLVAERTKRGADDVAVIRLEQLYPLSQQELSGVLAPYRDGTPLVWTQEDPWNMGGWYFLAARLPGLIGGRLPLSCAARDESASPATGSAASHKLEHTRLMEAAFA